MDYAGLIAAISRVHQQAQAGAAGAVNEYLALRNWTIGACLVEFEQRGQARAEYGTRLVATVATDLRKQGMKGLGVSMLRSCRQFYRVYPQIRQSAIGALGEGAGADAIRQSLIGESGAATASDQERLPTPLPPRSLLRLSWTHILELIRLDDPWKRAFYENECLASRWSVRQLQRQIGSLLYERTGLSADKQAVIERARAQATDDATEISTLIRDPYVLEFTGLAERADYRESDLESALLDHLQGFLLELGAGFCFEARQQRVTIGNEHDYIDLVFYHRLLRCHLLIDLKVRPFQHGDAGQMNFHLNYWRSEVTPRDDNPPVGLLLCSDANQTVAEYATGGLDHQLFVSRYLVALPQPEQLRQLVERNRAVWEQQRTDEGE